MSTIWRIMVAPVWASFVAAAYIPMVGDQDVLPYDYDEVFGTSSGTGVLTTVLHPAYSGSEAGGAESFANGLDSDSDDGFYMTPIVNGMNTSPGTINAWNEMKRAQGQASRNLPNWEDLTLHKSDKFIYGKPTSAPGIYLPDTPAEMEISRSANGNNNVTLVDYRMVRSAKDRFDDKLQNHAVEAAQSDPSNVQGAIDTTITDEAIYTGDTNLSDQGSIDQLGNVVPAQFMVTDSQNDYIDELGKLTETTLVEGAQEPLNQVGLTSGSQKTSEIDSLGNFAHETIISNISQVIGGTESMTAVSSSERTRSDLIGTGAAMKTSLPGRVDPILGDFAATIDALETQSADDDAQILTTIGIGQAAASTTDPAALRPRPTSYISEEDHSSVTLSAHGNSEVTNGINNEHFHPRYTDHTFADLSNSHQSTHEVNKTDDLHRSSTQCHTVCETGLRSSGNLVATSVSADAPEISGNSKNCEETLGENCGITNGRGGTVGVAGEIPEPADDDVEAIENSNESYLPLASEAAESGSALLHDYNTDDVEVSLEDIANYDSVFDYFRSSYFVGKFKERVLKASEALQSFEPQSEWDDGSSEEEEEQEKGDVHETNIPQDIEGINFIADVVDRHTEPGPETPFSDPADKDYTGGDSSQEYTNTDKFAEAVETSFEAIDIENSNGATEKGAQVINTPIERGSRLENASQVWNKENKMELKKAVTVTELSPNHFFVDLDDKTSPTETLCVDAADTCDDSGLELGTDDENNAGNYRQYHFSDDEIFEQNDEDYDHLEPDHLIFESDYPDPEVDDHTSDSEDLNPDQNDDSITDEELEQLMIEYEQWRYDSLSVVRSE